jgi:hypothetical protein
VSAPRSALTLALERILADGEWHGLGDVRAALVPLVPPGRAYRRSEADRLANTAGGVRVKGDRATAVAAGAGQVADDAVRSGVRWGRIERQGGRIRATRGAPRA